MGDDEVVIGDEEREGSTRTKGEDTGSNFEPQEEKVDDS